MKRMINLECAECLNDCIVSGPNIDSIQFCPFCGDPISVVDSKDLEDTFDDEDLDDVDLDEE